MAKGKARYVAAVQLPLGKPGQEDPERPGYEAVAVYEPGDVIDPKAHELNADTLQGLEANGYITREEA